MSEVTFAKSFLSTLDKKPVKLPADHVSDPKQYANQSPVRCLPINQSKSEITDPDISHSSSSPVKPTPSHAVNDPPQAARQQSNPP